MKIYVITCGKFDSNHVAYVTEKSEDAAKFISEHVGINDFDTEFVDMSCWENGKEIFCYGSLVSDKCNIVSISMTTDEVLKDIARHCSKL